MFDGDELHIEFNHSSHLVLLYWYLKSAHYTYVDITIPLIILNKTSLDSS